MDSPQQIILPTPTPTQKVFLDLMNREQLFGGGKGGGKTHVGCTKATLLSALIPGNRGLICRLTWPDLRDSTLETFKKVCPAEIRDWSASDKRHTVKTIDPKTPSTILWRSLGDPDDFEKVKGLEIGWLYIDEPTEVPLETYLMLLAQLRWVLPNGKRPPYMSFLTSNPEPGWVKERFVDSMIKGGIYIPSLMRDNPHLPPELLQTLQDQMPEIWKRKYIEGSWDVGEGTIFVELDAAVHVLEDIDWTGMRLVGCLDHATTGVTCYLQCGIDNDENLYALEEYYQKDRLISEHAQSIWSIQQKYDGRNDYTLVDPSTEAKTIQGPDELRSVLDEYHRNGIILRPARRNSIEVGLNLLSEYIHPSLKRRHPRTQQHGSPKLFIQRSKCPMLWKELTQLRKTVNFETGRITYVGTDHAVDCLRYTAMSRPNAAKLMYEKNVTLVPTDVNTIAGRSFSKWSKSFGKEPDENQWFPRPN